MIIMAIPFMIGAVIEGFISMIGSLIAWGCWGVLFILLLVERTKREKKK